MYEFANADKVDKHTTRDLIKFIPVLFVFLAFFVLIISDFNVGKVILPFIITIGICTAEILVISITHNRMARKRKLMIDDEKIIKQDGKKQEVVLWGDIAKVKYVVDYRGNLSMVIFRKKGRKVYLYRYEGMQTVVGIFKEKIE